MDYTRVIGEETDKTVATLNQLFEMMGSSSSEIQSELVSLNNNVAMVFESALEKAHAVKRELLAHMAASSELIHRSAKQLGEQNIVDKWNDVQADTSLTLKERASQIDKIVEAAVQKCTLRYSVMSGYASQLLTLYPLLGISPLPSLIEPRIRRSSLDTIHDATITCLTAERQASMEEEITTLERVKQQRIQTCHQLVIEIVALWKELGISQEEMTRDTLSNTIFQQYYTQTPSDISTATMQVGLSMVVLGELEHRRAALLAEKQHRQLERDAILREITALWDRCSIPTHERETFLAANQTLQSHFLQGYTAELHRMQSVKQSMMSHLIEKVRDDIRKIWSLLRYTMDECQTFQPAHVAIYTDQALTCHEQELERLQQVYQTMEPILTLVDKREKMRNEITEYELWLLDPANQADRLNSRNSFRILAKEEALRKMSTKELPRLETKLLNAITKWEKQHDATFKIDGESYAQVIRGQQEETEGIQASKKKVEDEVRVAKKAGRLSEAIPSSKSAEPKPNIYATMPSPAKQRNLSVYDVSTCTKPVTPIKKPVAAPVSVAAPTPAAAAVTKTEASAAVKVGNKENAPTTPSKAKKETPTTTVVAEVKAKKQHVGTPFGQHQEKNKTVPRTPVTTDVMKSVKVSKPKPAVPLFTSNTTTTTATAPTTPSKVVRPIVVKPSASKLKPKYATASAADLKRALASQPTSASTSTATTPRKAITTKPKKRKSTSAPTSPKHVIRAVDDIAISTSTSTFPAPTQNFRKMSFAANFSTLSAELKRKTEQGKMLYAKGSYQDALTLFTYVIDHAPPSTDLRDILHNRAHVYTKLHQYAEAMADSDRACSFVQQIAGNNQEVEPHPSLTNTDVDLEHDAVNRVGITA